MKLDFLFDGSPDCPLLRLFAFTPAESENLYAVVTKLSAGGSAVEVHRLPFVEPINECRLTLEVTSWDQGLVCRATPAEFTCGLTPGTWDNLAGLIEPFVADSRGYQWLAGGEAKLLLSAAGDW